MNADGRGWTRMGVTCDRAIGKEHGWTGMGVTCDRIETWRMEFAAIHTKPAARLSFAERPARVECDRFS